MCLAHPIPRKVPGGAPCTLCSLHTVGGREESWSRVEKVKRTQVEPEKGFPRVDNAASFKV